MGNTRTSFRGCLLLSRNGCRKPRPRAAGVNPNRGVAEDQKSTFPPNLKSFASCSLLRECFTGRGHTTFGARCQGLLGQVIEQELSQFSPRLPDRRGSETPLLSFQNSQSGKYGEDAGSYDDSHRQDTKIQLVDTFECQHAEKHADNQPGCQGSRCKQDIGSNHA